MAHLLSRQAVFDNAKTTIGYNISISDDHTLPTEQTTEMPNITLNQITNTATFLTYKDFANTQDLLSTLPNEKIFLELHDEDLTQPDIIEQLKALRTEQLHVAYTPTDIEAMPEEVINIADLIEIDTQHIHQEKEQQIIQSLHQQGKNILARNIRSHEAFAHWTELGADLFAGEYLCQPDLTQTNASQSNAMMTMKLLNLLQDQDVTIEAVEQALSADPNLVYKLLKAVNSPAFGLTREIESIHQAIVLIGLQQLKRWVSLAALSAIDGKPIELTNIAIIRAKMCELLGTHTGVLEPTSCFTVGLFSTLDALLDSPMTTLLQALNLAPELKAALLNHEGTMGQVLAKVINYERAAWHEIQFQDYKEYEQLIAAYVQSVEWADQYCASLRT